MVAIYLSILSIEERKKKKKAVPSENYSHRDELRRVIDCRSS